MTFKEATFLFFTNVMFIIGYMRLCNTIEANKVRDDIRLTFHKLTQEFYVMIVVFERGTTTKDYTRELAEIHNHAELITNHFRTYNNDLNSFSELFNDWDDSWGIFNQLFDENNLSEMTDTSRYRICNLLEPVSFTTTILTEAVKEEFSK